MADGNTYEAYEVARYILGNEKWMNKMKSMNERDRFSKLCNIMPAACRETKLKLTEAEQSTTRYVVMERLKEFA